jgi:hypothetical protein
MHNESNNNIGQLTVESTARPVVQPTPLLLSNMSTTWTPSSWREKPIAQVGPTHQHERLRTTDPQDVIYENNEHLDRVLGKLRKLPPLVSPVEVSFPST